MDPTVPLNVVQFEAIARAGLGVDSSGPDGIARAQELMIAKRLKS